MLRKNRAFNFLIAVFALGVGGILFPDSGGNAAAAKEDSGQARMLEFSASEQRYLRQKKRVSMCIDPDWMPYERIDKQGRHEGMSADYMALFEKRIGVPIELVPTKSWSESTDFAKARKCDILSMLNKSPERSQYLNFTEPYIQSQSVVVTRDDVTYLDGLKSVGTRSLSVPKGYVFEERIRKDYPNIKLVLVETVREGLNKVSNGEVFAHLGSIFIVVNEIQKNQLSNLKISGHSEYEMNFRIGVRKDDPLLLFVLNKAVGSLSEAEHIRIRRSWTATKLEHGVDYSLLWKVIGGALALLIAVMFWCLTSAPLGHIEVFS